MNYSSILSNLFPDLMMAIFTFGFVYGVFQAIEKFRKHQRGLYLSDTALKRLKKLSQHCNEISDLALYPEDQPKKGEVMIIDSQRAKVLRNIEYFMRPKIIEFALESALKNIQKDEDSQIYERLKKETLLWSDSFK